MGEQSWSQQAAGEKREGTAGQLGDGWKTGGWMGNMDKQGRWGQGRKLKTPPYHWDVMKV